MSCESPAHTEHVNPKSGGHAGPRQPMKLDYHPIFWAIFETAAMRRILRRLSNPCGMHKEDANEGSLSLLSNLNHDCGFHTS